MQARGSSWNPDPYTLQIGQVDEFLPKADANLYNDAAVGVYMKRQAEKEAKRLEKERKEREKSRREQRERYKRRMMHKRSNTKVDFIKIKESVDENE